MKIKQLFLFLLFLIGNKTFASDTINNYYHRDICSGQHQISFNKKLSSKILYETDYIENSLIIKGFYYDSDIIKFIDTYSNNELMKTEYFSKSGKKVFERFYKYNNEEKIVLVETYAQNDYTKLDYSSKHYFEYYDNNKIQVNYVINYSLNKKNRIEKYSCLGNLTLNEIYKPITCENVILISSETDSKIMNVSEKWNYKKSGYNYVCTVNNEKKCNYSVSEKKGITVKKELFDNKESFYQELFALFENKIYEKKKYDNYFQENKGICIQYEESYKEYLFDDLIHIYLEDEKIILQNDNVRTDNLCIPLDIFGFRYYAMDLALYE